MEPKYEVTEREYSWGTHVVLYKDGQWVMFVDIYNDGHYSIHDRRSW